MGFCAKCGTAVAEGAGFCPSCGAQTGAAGGGAPAAAAGTGMQENVAGLLCYILTWLTGLIFFLIDKRPFVRFHAAQSMVLFGAMFILGIVLEMVFFASFMGGLGITLIGTLLMGLVWIAGLVLWVLCMVKAYQGQLFKVPVVGDIAEKIAG